MKQIFFMAFAFFSGIWCSSQNSFTLSADIGIITVEVNGNQFTIDSAGTKIRTNFPRFDQIIFLSTDSATRSPIICNFKPDSVYTIVKTCCNTPDILPTSRLQNDSLKIWDIETDFDKIQQQLMDKPFISVKAKKKPKCNLYIWTADAGCFPEYWSIDTTLLPLGTPRKCFFWSNITTFQVFTTDETLAQQESADLEELLGIEHFVKLSAVSLRLFDNESFVIIFDEKTNNISVEYL